ncbi:AAC-rich mRNA AAC4 protein-like [Balamuthia mandrillaris]
MNHTRNRTHHHRRHHQHYHQPHSATFHTATTAEGGRTRVSCASQQRVCVSEEPDQKGENRSSGKLRLRSYGHTYTTAAGRTTEQCVMQRCTATSFADHRACLFSGSLNTAEEEGEEEGEDVGQGTDWRQEHRQRFGCGCDSNSYSPSYREGWRVRPRASSQLVRHEPRRSDASHQDHRRRPPSSSFQSRTKRVWVPKRRATGGEESAPVPSSATVIVANGSSFTCTSTATNATAVTNVARRASSPQPRRRTSSKPAAPSSSSPASTSAASQRKPELLVSLGPPQTFHMTADFVVRAAMQDNFTVPNSLTDPSTDSGRLVKNTISVHSSLRSFDSIHLTEGGRKIRDTPNAGGNSVASEVLSYELLRCMYGAELKSTEMELEYFPMGGKITDYSITLYSLHLGVSVTRAMKYNGIFQPEDAYRLLNKKLEGVLASSRLVMEPFHKQILHIFAEAEYVADVLEDVYHRSISPDLKADTLVVVTVTENCDWVFQNWYGSPKP